MSAKLVREICRDHSCAMLKGRIGHAWPWLKQCIRRCTAQDTHPSPALCDMWFDHAAPSPPVGCGAHQRHCRSSLGRCSGCTTARIFYNDVALQLFHMALHMAQLYLDKLKPNTLQAELINNDSVKAAQHTRLLVESPTAKQRVVLSDVLHI